MNFDFAEVHQLIRNTAAKFAQNEIAPIAREHDRHESYPLHIIAKAADAGLLGPIIPEQYGGPGFGFFEQALISEQLSRVDLGIAQVVESAAFGAIGVLLFGNEEQKRTWLPRVAGGEAISAGAFTEPDAGTDLAAVRTRANIKGGEYVITGNKMFITNGNVCHFFVVLCLTDPKAGTPHKGLSLLLVEADRPGIVSRPIKGKMGLRASDTAEVSFEQVRVPVANLLGDENSGFSQVMHFFDCTRTMVAAQGVGVAQGALDLAIRYCRQRHTFGRPLIANQSIQFTLAEMATRIEMARNSAYKAAWLVDQGRVDSKLVAMSKYFAAETAVLVCDKALQMHGGYGYIDEYDIQRFYRDAKVLEIYEGAKEAEKMAIAKKICF
jgi:alkylation response protein AidB-like acyl-CoA dehydrogenase